MFFKLLFYSHFPLLPHKDQIIIPPTAEAHPFLLCGNISKRSPPPTKKTKKEPQNPENSPSHFLSLEIYLIDGKEEGQKEKKKKD